MLWRDAPFDDMHPLIAFEQHLHTHFQIPLLHLVPTGTSNVCVIRCRGERVRVCCTPAPLTPEPLRGVLLFIVGETRASADAGSRAMLIGRTAMENKSTHVRCSSHMGNH